MSPRTRSAFVLTLCATLVVGAGCSWFGGRDSNDAVQTAPLADKSVYTPPVKADKYRTGDFRPNGVLNASATQSSPAETPTLGSIASDTRPLVLLPPTTRPIRSSGALPEYLVLGSVVANVNGVPIYGHELMKQVAPLLRARARELNETQFHQVARSELERQRRTLVQDELTYAAAERNTTAEEAKEAQARTFFMREQLISQAGGSVEMARQLARESGDDFDALLKKEQRRQLVGIYYRKRIIPRIAITVDEMRRYYEQNRDKVFTVPSQATIRLIRIDLKDVGSESAALDRINEARRRAQAGEDFETLVAEFNRMPLLVQSKGLVGPLSKGSYVIAAVDDAIWPTPAGGISPVIRTKDAFYLFKVVDKQEGRTQSFDEAAVQTQIQSVLSAMKQRDLTQRFNEALQKDAVIQADDAMLTPVVEMAMQLYGTWHEPH